MRISLCVFFFLYFSGLAYSQSNRQIRISDTKKNISITILGRDETILGRNIDDTVHTQFIRYSLNGDSTSSIVVQPKTDNNNSGYLKEKFLSGPFIDKFQFFDFTFEADRLVFNKNYTYPQSLNLEEIKQIIQNNKSVTNRFIYLNHVDLYLDSTILHLSADKPKAIYMAGGTAAKYTGDLRGLEAKIKKAVKKMKQPVDSTLVYEAVIFRRHSEYHPEISTEKFELRGLLYGTPSAFSTIVEQYLRDHETNYQANGRSKWQAARLLRNDRPIDSKIKIYVHLSKEGNVEIKLPKVLGSPTGD